MSLLLNVGRRVSVLSFEIVRRGFDALFFLDVTRELLRAVDVRKLRSNAPISDAVDLERIGAVVGQPGGRVIAHILARTVTSGGLAGLVLREISGRLVARAIRSLVRKLD